jgi:hypothetical protein
MFSRRKTWLTVRIRLRCPGCFSSFSMIDLNKYLESSLISFIKDMKSKRGQPQLRRNKIYSTDKM